MGTVTLFLTVRVFALNGRRGERHKIAKGVHGHAWDRNYYKKMVKAISVTERGGLGVVRRQGLNIFKKIGSQSEVSEWHITSISIVDAMRFRDGSNKGTASHFVQISEKCDADPGNEQTSVRERKLENAQHSLWHQGSSGSGFPSSSSTRTVPCPFSGGLCQHVCCCCGE
jgi:hypothetical protein